MPEDLTPRASSKSTIRFWLRVDRKNQDNTCPVHLVYQIKGNRKYYSADVKVLEDNWSIEDQRAVYTKFTKEIKAKGIKPHQLASSKDIDSINKDLDTIKLAVQKAEDYYKSQDLEYDVNKVIARLNVLTKRKAVKLEPGDGIAEFIDLFIGQTKDHREGTLKEYRTLYNHMIAFEESQTGKHKNKRFTFACDVEILWRFSSYLTEEVGINDITKSKIISTFKTLLRHAKKDPFKKQVNPEYFDIHIRRSDDELEVIALTEEELAAIQALDLSEQQSLDRARDIFVFSCHTGLRYGDLASLQHHHITKDNFIRKPASHKNSKKIEVPLNQVSYDILQKYKDTLRPLPVTANKLEMITDQKLNPIIKELGAMAGINEPMEIVRQFNRKDVSLGVFPKCELLSIHSARKTFITLALARGIAIQDVMAMSTHSSFKAVKRYIDVTGERKKAIFEKAYGKIKENNLKAVI